MGYSSVKVPGVEEAVKELRRQGRRNLLLTLAILAVAIATLIVGIVR